MSSKSVRKLLRQSNTEEAYCQKSRPVKRKRTENSGQNPQIVDDSVILQKNIESILKFDYTLKGKEEQGKFILPKSKKKTNNIIGNSRSSAAQAKSSKHEPTSNKRR
eukprot:CAMPEP_0178904154 /NCGR_PEP_ID=MMETSP0786-20121207/5541_1 /TAXON_ID=186022 /ORGANISM="Thalassionema frauenfeldii, Strain CCMP 1798" /LENGTH=106 /DNA_ID=CAMNT_0020575577 /DNA_START=81 /DNA_END=397 /DNA_ORIENTATION=-